MPLSEEYKVVMSIGMRCFTEIFLKDNCQDIQI